MYSCEVDPFVVKNITGTTDETLMESEILLVDTVLTF